MRMTIKQIAELAGVSRATVSKIINNYDDVGEKTKKKVLDIMEEHNYRPSYSAQSLAKKKTNVIGVVYAGEVNADFNHPFFVEVMNAFKKKIGFLGYDLLFFSNEKFHRGEEDYLERCLHYNVDGCIIVSGANVQPSVYELDRSEVPCIGIDVELTGPKSAYVTTDNETAVDLVLEHLAGIGHQKIGYVTGVQGSDITEVRNEYFRRAVKKRNLTVHEAWVVEGDFFEESGYLAGQQLLTLNEQPTAVFAASDMMALGLQRALREAGEAGRFGVVGIDDITAARHVDPPLTTVRQQQKEFGNTAADMLDALIRGEEVKQKMVLPAELIVRDSCRGRLLS
ncbi:LacI family DNA-binding transcriptional regulator [Alkalicoccus chagannorensis]|uniref:LacI family DNA-binding transcriptional regulator n=1 Tax=Alkalicoccus chagannorensis TaxID=427072 RepID=UPI000401FAC3|nr:LacI family DNA-binding transcriptional regulator [Alkalicoccus chagannorensis]